MANKLFHTCRPCPLRALQAQLPKKPLHSALSDDTICAHQQAFLFMIVPASQYCRKGWTKSVLNLYNFVPRRFWFLCRNKIITSRFRAWQRYCAPCPNFFCRLPSGLLCYRLLGQAQSRSRGRGGSSSAMPHRTNSELRNHNTPADFGAVAQGPWLSKATAYRKMFYDHGCEKQTGSIV